MLPIIIIMFQGIDDRLQMLFITKKVRIGGIHKKRFDIVLFDIMSIRLLQVKQVFIGN